MFTLVCSPLEAMIFSGACTVVTHVLSMLSNILSLKTMFIIQIIQVLKKVHTLCLLKHEDQARLVGCECLMDNVMFLC